MQIIFKRTGHLCLNAHATSTIRIMAINIGADIDAIDAIAEIGSMSGINIINHHAVIRIVPLPLG